MKVLIMKKVKEKNQFMAGMYMIEFNSKRDASDFISKYSDCPVWPILARGRKDNEVLIIAIEYKKQNHGDFTEDNNTLVEHPEYLGATEVKFKRDDSLIDLISDYTLITGYSDKIPCGSNCEQCHLFKNSCLGCPAFYDY